MNPPVGELIALGYQQTTLALHKVLLPSIIAERVQILYICTAFFWRRELKARRPAVVAVPRLEQGALPFFESGLPASYSPVMRVDGNGLGPGHCGVLREAP
jgi:hypothetical protein